MQAFPFLFSKNPAVGRKAIVLPGFLNGEEGRRLVSHLTTVTLARGYTEPGQALYVEGLHHPQLGPLHVVFRNRRATTADLGRTEAHPEILNAGRGPVYLSEGFIEVKTRFGL
jgi:hypothetical protein